MNKIKVKRELLADWLATLRSGKYKQATSTLVDGPNSQEPAYCCLGVKVHLENSELCNSYFNDIFDSDVQCQIDTYTEWYREFKGNDEFYTFINTKITENQIVETLLTSLNDGVTTVVTNTNLGAPDAEVETVKYIIRGFISRHDDIYVNYKGVFKFNFSQIADFIEEELVEYID